MNPSGRDRVVQDLIVAHKKFQPEVFALTPNNGRPLNLKTTYYFRAGDWQPTETSTSRTHSYPVDDEKDVDVGCVPVGRDHIGARTRREMSAMGVQLAACSMPPLE